MSSAAVPVSARPVSGQGLASYALLGLPLALTALPVNILLPDFYAREAGLALTAIGLALLATRLVDALADPLLGAWVDRQKSRGGYLRPILIAAPPLAIGFALLLHPPAVGAGAALAWLLATLVACSLGYSLAIVAYQAWGAELAHDDAGRTRITAAREGAGLVGVLIGGAVPAALGMSPLVWIFLACLALALAVLARGAPRLSRPPHAPVAGSPFASFLLPLATSRLRWLLAVFALNAVAPSITATVFQFFVADRLGLAQYTGLFLALYFIAGAASMPLWVRLARRRPLHLVWLAGMVAAVAAFIWAVLLGEGQFGAFALICVLSGVAFGADLALPPALLARVIDANGHGGQREGAYFGLWNFVNKLTLALAAGIALPLLEALGYVRGASSAEALGALAFVYAVVPCLLKLTAAGLLLVAWRRQRF